MKKDTVKCPLCHFDNPADTFFCGKCEDIGDGPIY